MNDLVSSADRCQEPAVSGKKPTAQQAKALALLHDRGGEWFNGCGWSLGLAADCHKAMKGLAQSGYVERISNKGGLGHYRLIKRDGL